MDDMATIVERLDRIERLLTEQKSVREYYGTEDMAEVFGKSEFTCREWCRLGRVNAQKRQSGRGKHAAWVITHAEMLRIQKDGLLPGHNQVGY